ncbi:MULTISPECIES: hypothetical protein [unclassified Mesorhizobium]|uniref:hypothetical protein n=1 Tax=unclassified Mesorhizobium TaxID=325217 RepID=UPI001FDFA45B|nr:MULTISPECIES: hypothetical protein [unclassified Mesorhizobium]
MSDTKRVSSDPKQGRVDTMSIAVGEAFEYLNAGTRKHYRGAGDTASAARDRAAREAGISPAQAERLWKRWRTMASVDGDVYRALRNQYERLCERVENAAEAMEREARDIEANNATLGGHRAVAEGVAGASKGAEREMR